MSIKLTLRDLFIYRIYLKIRYIVARYIIARSFKSQTIHPKVSLNAVDDGICFFGYYNISPCNTKDDLLYLKVTQETPRGSLKEPVSIILNNNTGKVAKIGQSKAWNWQQGCMLQWFAGNDDLILFNDYDEINDRYISKVIDKEGNPVKSYPIPVNSVSKCGTYALTLNYDRLAMVRPDYGYFNRENQELLPDEQDGIWHLDLETGKYKLIISLARLKELSFRKTMDGAVHKVNHIIINPGGSRFVFLHRWTGHQGRYMRLISSNPDGSELCILNGDIMTSHYCWLDDQHILSYCKYIDKTGYFKFKDKSNDVHLFSIKMPDADGHPSVSPDGQWLITDTYPGKARMSCLYLFNINTDEITKLGQFHQPLRYNGEMRVDLHPKWTSSGNSFFFESAHQENRNLYKLDLSFHS